MCGESYKHPEGDVKIKLYPYLFFKIPAKVHLVEYRAPIPLASMSGRVLFTNPLQVRVQPRSVCPTGTSTGWKLAVQMWVWGWAARTWQGGWHQHLVGGILRADLSMSNQARGLCM